MPTLQASLFIERLLRFLIPYFTDVGADLAAARAEALETLAAYGARTRAELLCAVQIIVFSFAALEALSETKTTDMSSSMRIRFRGCANNLNRNSQKTEQTLAKRLACDAPRATDTAADPINDLPDLQVEDILQQTQAMIETCHNQASGHRSASTSNPQPPTLQPPTLQPPTLQPDVSQPVTPQPITPQPTTAQPTTAQPATPRPSAPWLNALPLNVQPSSHGQKPSILLTQAEQNKRLWGAAMMDTLTRMGMPVQPAPKPAPGLASVSKPPFQPGRRS